MQAVALVFDHVQTAMEGSTDKTQPLDSPHSIQKETNGAQDGETLKGSKPAQGHAATIAALKLLDDLCMMATGPLLTHFC